MLFIKKNKNKFDATEAVIEKANGRSVKYVSERDENGIESILGRNGRIIASKSEIAVTCDAKDVFVCKRQGAVVSELLSLDGIRIEGECFDGTKRTVTAFYTNYRK